tara:strand:+ start:192 stop:2075 length:1884 start_codon:yes stop_codon:yes gene_type:complete
MEFYFMENMVLSSIAENSNDPYTCQAKEYPFLACLDIAAPSTLSGTINRTYSVNSEQDLLQSVTTTYIGIDSTATNLFGAITACDGKTVGDGLVSSLDMNVLMWYQFRVPPYNSLSEFGGQVSTVNGETHPGDRCQDDITRIEYLGLYDVNYECTIPRPSRRLEETNELDAEIIWHTDCEDGSWYQVKLKNNYIAIELLLEGADSDDIITRSNNRAPWDRNEEDLKPEDPSAYEVRFARHLEYIDSPSVHSSDCGIITPLVTPDAVMYRSTIGIGQVPTVDRPLLCPFDVFLWVPDAHSCGVNLKAGSRAMDGVRGEQLHNDVRCSIPSAPPAEPISPHSSPPPPPPGSPGPPPPNHPPPTPPANPNNYYEYTVTGVITVEGSASDVDEDTFKDGIVSQLNEEWETAFGSQITPDDVVITTTSSSTTTLVSVTVSGLSSSGSNHVVEELSGITAPEDISAATGTNITVIENVIPRAQQVSYPSPPGSPPSPTPPPPPGKSDPAMIALIVLAAIGTLCCGCFVVAFLVMLRKKKEEEDAEKGQRRRPSQTRAQAVNARNVNIRVFGDLERRAPARPPVGTGVARQSTALDRARAANPARRNSAPTKTQGPTIVGGSVALNEKRFPQRR